MEALIRWNRQAVINWIEKDPIVWKTQVPIGLKIKGYKVQWVKAQSSKC